jgi:hypothetical protein
LPFHFSVPIIAKFHGRAGLTTALHLASYSHLQQNNLTSTMLLAPLELFFLKPFSNT